MNNFSEFSAFIESVCTKVGCPDAAPYLQQGFRAFVESFSDTYADDPFARNKLRTRLVRKPPTTKDIETSVTKSMDKGESNQKAMSLDQFGKFYDKQQTEKQNERVRQTGKYNDMMARQNADTIRNLPWDNIKDLFPNAYCVLVGEVWQMKYLRRDKEKDVVTGKGKVLGAVGEYVPKTAPEKFDNPTMAALAAERFFTPGHWRVQRVIPELGDPDILAEQPSSDDDRFTNVINSDS